MFKTLHLLNRPKEKNPMVWDLSSMGATDKTTQAGLQKIPWKFWSFHLTCELRAILLENNDISVLFQHNKMCDNIAINLAIYISC